MLQDLYRFPNFIYMQWSIFSQTPQKYGYCIMLFLSWWFFCSCSALPTVTAKPAPSWASISNVPPSRSLFLILPTRDYHFFLWFLHGIFPYLIITSILYCSVLYSIIYLVFSFLCVLFFYGFVSTLKTKISVIDGSHPLTEGPQHF